ncbi:MAG: hypothetical protein FJ100_06250 [Deltaproteobacteria bacterium]|nr:hypothetical protein [Deltaproteobacteria bacterium]
MNKTKWLALLALAIAAAAVVAWQVPRAARTAVAQAPLLRVPPSAGAEAFLHAHASLLQEAARLERPTDLPTLVAVDRDIAEPPAAAGTTSVLPPVPPEAQVHLAFTSSVLGELDPCG